MFHFVLHSLCHRPNHDLILLDAICPLSINGQLFSLPLGKGLAKVLEHMVEIMSFDNGEGANLAVVLRASHQI